MGLLDVGLKKEDRELIQRLVSILETVVHGKKLVITVNFEDKFSATFNDIKK